MICVFAMSVVGQDLKRDMFSYIILSLKSSLICVLKYMLASGVVIIMNGEEAVLLTYIMTL